MRATHPHVRPAAALAFALMMGLLALGLARAALLAFSNLNLPGPVFVPTAEPRPVVVTPPRRVLTVLVDGLRADVAQRLPFIGGLARHTHAALWADLPTYSAAQYVAALGGVRPADSGVRGNFGLLRTPLDSVPARVRAAGRVAVEVGDGSDWWLQLFGDDFTRTGTAPTAELVDRTRAEKDHADLLLVHLCDVDTVGHTLGAAHPDYEKKAREMDVVIRELALAWGWPDATIVVLSDHGHHYPRGGHGGGEEDVRRAFLVASGPGVARGTADGRMVDVAPTLAALLGVPSPAQAQGRTLSELLDLDAEQRGALLSADVARQARVAAAVAASRGGLVAAERKGQLLRGLGVAAALVLLLPMARRALRRARLGLAFGAASTALTAVLYLFTFETVSFSADRDASTLCFSTITFGFVACALTFIAPLTAVIRRKLGASDACAFGFLAVAGASPVAACMFVVAGAFTPRLTCEPAWLAVLPLLSYGALIPVVLFASALAMIAAAVALLPRRVRVPERVATAPLHAEARP